jgi:hypothetical protein
LAKFVRDDAAIAGEIGPANVIDEDEKDIGARCREGVRECNGEKEENRRTRATPF